MLIAKRVACTVKRPQVYHVVLLRDDHPSEGRSLCGRRSKAWRTLADVPGVRLTMCRRCAERVA